MANCFLVNAQDGHIPLSLTALRLKILEQLLSTTMMSFLGHPSGQSKRVRLRRIKKLVEIVSRGSVKVSPFYLFSGLRERTAAPACHISESFNSSSSFLSLSL